MCATIPTFAGFEKASWNKARPEARACLQGGGELRRPLLFSDIQMPGGMSGVGLAVQARQIKSSLPVLLTSGYPAENGDAAARGEFAMIRKPYRRDALAKMLRWTLSVGPSATQ